MMKTASNPPVFSTPFIATFNKPRKTNMTMEKQPFEDVSPVKHDDLPASHVSFRGGGYRYHRFCCSFFVGPKGFANFSRHRLSCFEDTIAVNSVMKEMPWREVSWGIMGPQEMLPHGSGKSKIFCFSVGILGQQ